MTQALRNLVNKSCQRIAKVYSKLEKRLKSSAKKKEALEQANRRHQNENYEDFEISQDPISENIRTAVLSKTEDTNIYSDVHPTFD